MRRVLTLVAVAAFLALAYAEEQNVQAQEDDVSVRDARAKGKARSEMEEKASVITDPEELKKYNGFIDVLLRRVGVQMRSRTDPISIKLEKKKKNNNRSSPKKAKKTSKKAKKDKKSKKSNSSKPKSRKERRHPRDFTIEKEEDDDEQVPAEAEEQEQTEERQKRDVDMDEDEEDEAQPIIELEEDEFEELFGSRVERDLEDMEEEEDEDDEIEDDDEEDALERVERDVGEEPQPEDVNRKGKPAAKNSGKAKKNNKRSKGQRNSKKNDKKGKKGKGKKKAKKNSNSKKTSRSKKSASINSGPSPRATVNGLGSFTRFGDVAIKTQKDKRSIHANFKSGPIAVKVSKAGTGKDKSNRNAKASTQGIDGTIIVEIGQDGKATVKKLRILNPTEIRVEGSLGKTKQTNNFMNRSFRMVFPTVSKKLKFAARDILKESSKKIKA